MNAKLNELNKRAFCTLASIKQLMHVKYAKYEMESGDLRRQLALACLAIRKDELSRGKLRKRLRSVAILRFFLST